MAFLRVLFLVPAGLTAYAAQHPTELELLHEQPGGRLRLEVSPNGDVQSGLKGGIEDVADVRRRPIGAARSFGAVESHADSEGPLRRPPKRAFPQMRVDQDVDRAAPPAQAATLVDLSQEPTTPPAAAPTTPPAAAPTTPPAAAPTTPPAAAPTTPPAAAPGTPPAAAPTTPPAAPAPAPAAPAPGTPPAAPAPAPAAPAPVTPAANAIVVAPTDSTPPPPDNAAARSAKYKKDFMEANPLLETNIWSVIGIPLVVGMTVLMFVVIAVLLAAQGSQDEEENELELPENMYGETFATTIMSAYKYKRDGGATLPVLCELFSSVVLLAVTYVLVYIMIQVAYNTISSVEADVEERDSLFEKFRDPVIWQAQNWQLFPDSVWRRDSMVWFCHDIIYGKAKHVNELGPIWFMFSWVVLVIWFAYMLFELRECFKLKLMIWNSPTTAPQDMVTVDKEEGKIVVNGLSMPVKGVVTLIVLIPKLALNLMVAYIGCVFLLFNDLDDDLQEILLKTIEMAFILEMDELIFEAFAATHKKQQLGNLEMPTVKEKGVWRVLSRYGEFPRFMLCIGLASYLTWKVNTDENRRNILTDKQGGVIEGCCNFMQYLKGAGVKTKLAEGNPCTNFRETYEGPMGLDTTGGILPPGDVPAVGTTSANGELISDDTISTTLAPIAAAAAAGDAPAAAAALMQLGAKLLWNHVASN